MNPTFDLGPISFPSYFTMLTIGFMLAIWLAWREAGRIDVDQNKLLDLSLIALIGGLIGARILHVIADGYWQDYVNLCVDPYAIAGKHLPHGWKCPSDYVCQLYGRGDLCNPDAGTCHPGRDCLRVVKIWYGGLAYYGGFLLSFAAGLWYIWRQKMNVWKVTDLVGFGIPLGLIFGRLGCWFAGCCYGRPGGGVLGVHFPKGSPAWKDHVDTAASLRHLYHDWFPHSSFIKNLAESDTITRAAEVSYAVHPTQLYSAITNAMIFLFCYWMFKKRRTYDGKVWWWFMLLYGVSRSVIEYWRDDARGVWFGNTLSTSQLISLPLIALALYMMWRGHRSLNRTV